MADDRFGRALRQRRMQAGLSLSGLSLRVHFSPSYLSRVESGERSASTALARLCDTALEAGGELAALAHRAAARKSVPGGSGGPRAAAGAGAPGGQEAPAAGPPYTAVAAHGWEDERDNVRHFVGHLAELRRLAQRLPPSLVLEQIVPSVRTLEVLARAARTPAGRRGYLEVCAFYCEFASWMSQEAGDPARADRWIGRTERLAAEAGFTDLADHAPIRRACLALYQGDAESVIRLAMEAGRRSTASPRVRALAAYREAQGLALAGRAALCEAALDRGAELLAADTRGNRGSAPPAGRAPSLLVGSGTTAGRPGLISGWCLYDLGRPAEAAAALSAELPLVPGTARRARALFTARLALCLIAAGEYEAAARTGEDLLLDSAGLYSSTLLSQHRLLAAVLRRRLSHPDLRELYQHLAVAGA